MAMTARTSPTFSRRDDSVNEDGRNTISPGGDPTATKPWTAQPSLKRSMESASSSDSITSVAYITPAFAQPKKKRSKRPPRKPTENHLKVQAVVGAVDGEKWELILEEFDGLMDEGACGCIDCNKVISICRASQRRMEALERALPS
jgi:hypothetical protein